MQKSLFFVVTDGVYRTRTHFLTTGRSPQQHRCIRSIAAAWGQYNMTRTRHNRRRPCVYAESTFKSRWKQCPLHQGSSPDSPKKPIAASIHRLYCGDLCPTSMRRSGYSNAPKVWSRVIRNSYTMTCRLYF